DGDMEIFVNVRNHPDGWVYAFQGDGSIIEGWPATLDYIPGASISVGDLDNDGTKEVVALSYNSLYVFDMAGEVLDGFPFTETGTTVSYSQPVLFDMDSDGDLEILYGACTDAGGKVFAFHHDGSMVEGWPNITSNWVFATPALGDVDGDGELDVVIGDQVSSSEAADYIYAWDMEGNDLAGFPAGPTFAIYTQAAIADIDGDDYVEIMIDDNRFGIGYECYNHDGSHDDEWPLACGTVWSSTTMLITPVIGDFNNDGFLDITGAATDIMGWVVEAYVWTTNSVWNEDLAYSIVDGHNVQHDGVYPAMQEFFPEPPQNVMAEVVEFNSIMIFWEPPINEVPSAYNVYLDGEFLSAVTEDTYTHNDFDEGIYNIQVSATYPGGYESEHIGADPVEVFFFYPANLTYEVVPAPEVILNWDFPVARNIEAFVIYRDGVEIDQAEDLTYTDITVENELSYEYYVTALYSGGYESEATNTVEVYVTGSEGNDFPAIETKLLGNYPNPFNPNTVISFQVSSEISREEMKLLIYNINGQLIKQYSVFDYQSSIEWNGKDYNGVDMPSGIYLYQLNAGDYLKTNKMLLLK
ncbi:FG-GAP-like repeat-containing protein, partial [Candidatus Cloacimonadota bacterium]